MRNENTGKTALKNTRRYENVIDKLSWSLKELIQKNSQSFFASILPLNVECRTFKKQMQHP